MTDDAPTMGVDGFTRKFWSEADRLALMAEFGRWDGTQVSFRGAGGCRPGLSGAGVKGTVPPPRRPPAGPAASPGSRRGPGRAGTPGCRSATASRSA